MHRLFLLLFFISLISCESRSPRLESIEADNLSIEQIDSVLTEFRFEYENPIVIDSSDFVLIPISTELLERRKTFSSDGYYADDYPRYWNILFYNRATGESRLLTEEKVRISRIHTTKNQLEFSETIDRLYTGKVLLEIADIDFNKDERLDSDDPDYLFICNIDGGDLTRLSPLGEDLVSYKVMPNSNQIIMNTRRDSNLDSLFDNSDDLIWHKTEYIDGVWQSEEMIDSLDRKRIQRLYFDQWLKKK